MSFGISPQEYDKLRRLIEEECGIDLGPDKAYLVESRLAGFVSQPGISSFEDLFLSIVGSRDRTIIEKVIEAVVTNETFWFRDKTPWLILENILMPAYLKQLASGKRTKVRIWSAACSSGQEPYSITMCIDRYLARQGPAGVSLSQFEIVATDISNTIINTATMGIYDSISISRGLDEEYKTMYFKNSGRVWAISDKIREAVKFRKFNLQDDFYGLGKFDIVFLRNVLIYFSDKLKSEITGKISEILDKEGVLFIGSSELFPENSGRFVSEKYREGIYYKLKD